MLKDKIDLMVPPAPNTFAESWWVESLLSQAAHAVNDMHISEEDKTKIICKMSDVHGALRKIMNG